MLNSYGGVVGHPHGDQNGLGSLPGEGLIVHLLSRVTKVHVVLVAASIWLKEVASPIGCDPRLLAQPPCEVLWLNVVRSRPIFPCPSGEDVVVEVVGGGQHPPIIAGQLCPSSYGEEDVPQDSDELALVGLWCYE